MKDQIMKGNESFDYNSHIAYLTTLIDQERQSSGVTSQGLAVVNGLVEIEEHRARQAEINNLWEQLQKPLRRIKSRIDAMPTLPVTEHIMWAQSISKMESARLLEIDTNSLYSDVEIIRVALSDVRGNVTFDQLIALPEGASVNESATKHNCLTDADLAGAPAIQEVWPAILQALSGCYLISFNNEWDIKTLKAAAEKHGLPVPVMIGECLQRRSTQYYLKEYYLDLPVVSKRMGHKMASYDALDRLKAQAAVVAGMAQGIVDVSEPEEQIAAPAATESSTGEIISSSDDDGLGDLSDHPF